MWSPVQIRSNWEKEIGSLSSASEITDIETSHCWEKSSIDDPISSKKFRN